jgi:fermentation-respiration switch protein FrsA (DUF1100 family)
MGPMFRRTLLVAALPAALAGCSPDRASSSAPSPAAPGSVAPSPAAPSPAAGTAPATPSAGAGAPRTNFPVRTRTLKLTRNQDRPLPTTVWYPVGDGPFPLILFSHGLTAQPSDYADLLTAWARAGFVVAAPAYPHTSTGVRDYNVLDVLNQPADASYVITQTLAARIADIDPGRIAAAGHSAGGVTTIGLFSTSRDDRLSAGVVLAGRQLLLGTPFTGPAAPLLFVHGRLDRTVAYADGRLAYDAVTWPKAFLTLPRGGHVAAGRDLAVIAATTTDFWRWSLYGDAAAKKRLGADATKGGRATLTSRL